MKIECEYELNRAWVLDNKTGNVIGETNFIVDSKWLKDLYNNEFADKYLNFNDFIETYEPEVDGEFVYQKAIKDNVLEKDLGIVMC